MALCRCARFQATICFLARLVERAAPVVKELLLPLVNLRWLQAEFVAQIGNGHLVNEMPSYGTEFLVSGKNVVVFVVSSTSDSAK